MIPENCKLIAHWTGEGWYLAVQDRGRDIAILAYPEAWPESVDSNWLHANGFEIV